MIAFIVNELPISFLSVEDIRWLKYIAGSRELKKLWEYDTDGGNFLDNLNEEPNAPFILVGKSN